jgi:hypothetical protein
MLSLSLTLCLSYFFSIYCMNVLLLLFKQILNEIIFNISQNNRLFSALKMFV